MSFTFHDVTFRMERKKLENCNRTLFLYSYDVSKNKYVFFVILIKESKLYKNTSKQLFRGMKILITHKFIK